MCSLFPIAWGRWGLGGLGKGIVKPRAKGPWNGGMPLPAEVSLDGGAEAAAGREA